MRRTWLLGAALACAVATPAASENYKAPRTAFGQPDLSGEWTNATLTPQTRNMLFGTRRALTPDEVKLWEGAQAAKDAAGQHGQNAASDNVGAYDRTWIDNGVGVMRVNGEPRTSLITTPDGQPPVAKGQAPRKLPPEAGTAEAGRKAIKASAEFDQFEAQGRAEIGKLGNYDDPEGRSLGERCVLGFGRNAGPPMFPNGWYNNNYVINQTPDSVAIVVEMVHDARVVRLNARHRSDDVRPWFGDSIGWWDGDTLVVETDHFPKEQAFFGSWEGLKVTERFTRVGKDRLLYRFTAEDPAVWNKPWGGEYEFRPLHGHVFEYACHEGNYALPGILSGARAGERAAVEAKTGAKP
jgi:hypothetical protein